MPSRYHPWHSPSLFPLVSLSLAYTTPHATAHTRARCPSEEEYREMVLDKTGGLFRLAVGLMAGEVITQDIAPSLPRYLLLCNSLDICISITP